MRAAWTWPLATGTVTAGELVTRASAFDPVAFSLAVASGCAMGTWLAALGVLAAIMARRRGWAVPARLRPSDPTLAVLAGAAALAVVLTAIAVWLADVALEIVAAHPLDYPQTGEQLVRGGVLLAIPIAVLVVVCGAAPVVRWLGHGARASRVLRGSGALLVVVLCTHFGSGAFVVYFGPLLPL
ncbi:MAG TPA: hypothetical protein VFG69_15420, partial [Nannocystaceae bacterium]|nr:hypothetical protein [Nannocystaceae bacterium]